MARILVIAALLLAVLVVPARAADPCAHPKPSSTGAPTAGQPVNDPLFARQWGLAQIHAPAAWARGARGAGVTIAVIDSGLDRSHPEVAGKVLAGGGDFVGQSDGGCPGPEDEEGHGTHVATIAAAVTGNGIGGAGVAPDAVILPERVVDATGTYADADLVEGVDAAVRSGARVINLSLSTGTSGTLAGAQLAPAVEKSVSAAIAAGVVVVAAAGNLSQPICAYPASVRGVVCVAATDSNELPSFYSNQPADPDATADDGTTPVRAPGGSATSTDCSDETSAQPVDILSATLPGSPIDTCTGLAGYETLAGSSQATPHVAGVAALLVGAGLSGPQVRACLRATSRQPDGSRGVFTPAYGYGIVDAEAALATCAPDFHGVPGGGSPAAPAPAHSSPQPGGSPPSASSAPPLPSFAARTMRADWRGATLRLACRADAPCAAILRLRAARRTVVRVPVAIPARRTLAVRVRWQGRAPRVRSLSADLVGAAGRRAVTLRVRRAR